MFERFTGRARHVVVLAQEEARLLDHNYIGTEHILLGLLGEPESVAGIVLATFGMTRDGVREEVTKIIGRGSKAPSGHIPFTPRAKKVLELSLREALQLKHNYIGTEHILLGLIREGDGVGVQILRGHVDLLELRVAVLDAVSSASPAEAAAAAEAAETGDADETNTVLRWLRGRLTRRAVSLPFRPEAFGPDQPPRGTPAVEAALRKAATLAGPAPVGSHHLLLAALEDGDSAASATLASLGVDIGDLRRKLRSAKIAGTTDEQPEQAGRRQMALEVSPEILTIVLTDPLIVAAANEALRAVNASAAATSATAGAAAELTAEWQDETGPGEDGEAADGTPASATVIRGDHPAAANLAKVWLELRKTLATLASVTPVKPAGDAPSGAAQAGAGEAGAGEGEPGSPGSPGEDTPGEEPA
jgi:ATP-dependent Clp protease ATP-binding subunit ClpA